MEHLTTNVVTVLVEVLVVAFLFALVYWLGRRVLGLLASSKAMERFATGVRTLRRTYRNVVLGLAVFVCLGVAVGNGIWAWRTYTSEREAVGPEGEVEGIHLPDATLEKLREVPQDFWVDVGAGLGLSIGLVIAAAIALGLVRRLLDALCRGAKAYEGIRANDESIERFFASLTRVVRRATWLAVLAWSARLVGLPDTVYAGIMLILTIYLIIALGVVVWRALDAIIASVDALSNKYAETKDLLRYYDKLKPLMPTLQRSMEWVIFTLVATMVLRQVDPIAGLADWGPRIVRVIGIAFLARVLVAIASLLIEEFLLERPKLTAGQRQRRTTLVPLFRSLLDYLIYFTAGILILKEIGLDPTPVLAGAGILALAVGLGAQNLINDVVSGFFILFENHFLVGDFIRVNDAEGTVESIELRTTRIRDVRGRLHIVRNGMIDQLINYSKEYTFAMVEVGVAYESDLDKVFPALEEAGKRIAESSGDVLAPTVVQGVENFGESELTMRTVTKVKPGRHRQIQRDLRKVIKEVFNERGIEIPYARRVIIPRPEDGGDVETPAA